MVNNRIKELIEILDLSNSEFADLIGVQRSGISHLISGRNKPSLDFIEKLHEHYPDLNSDWLLFGTGVPFGKIKSNVTPASPTLFQEDPSPPDEQNENSGAINNVQELNNQGQSTNENPVSDSQRLEKRIKSVIILYQDGSFEEIQQKKT